MHMLEFFAKFGARTRSFSLTKLRHALVRKARQCTACEADTGAVEILFCGSACRALFSARKVERAAVVAKTGGFCAKCGVDLLQEESPAWEANHVVPVYDGGGCCTIENLEPLCLSCHRGVSADQAHCRALRRA